MSILQTPRSYKTLELSKNRLEIVDRKVVNSIEPQLIMKPLLVGICRSDIKEFLGTRTIRHDFGHEILAEIVESNIMDNCIPKIGDFVVLDPHIEIQRTSGFGELVVATGSKENLAKAFMKVPASVIKDRLIFIEPLACAHHCVSNLLRFRQRRDLKGLSIGIVGAGMTGTLIGLLCKQYGATIKIINRSKKRLDFLESTSIFSAAELSLSLDVRQEFDAVIPTTTFLFPEVLKFCEERVKEAGLVMLYGGTKAGDVHPGVKGVDIDSIRRKQLSIGVTVKGKNFNVCGTHGAKTKDFRAAAALLENSSQYLPVEKLISRRISLNRVPKTIIEMSEREALGKTVVEF